MDKFPNHLSQEIILKSGKQKSLSNWPAWNIIAITQHFTENWDGAANLITEEKKEEAEIKIYRILKKRLKIYHSIPVSTFKK